MSLKLKRESFKAPYTLKNIMDDKNLIVYFLQRAWWRCLFYSILKYEGVRGDLFLFLGMSIPCFVHPLQCQSLLCLSFVVWIPLKTSSWHLHLNLVESEMCEFYLLCIYKYTLICAAERLVQLDKVIQLRCFQFYTETTILQRSSCLLAILNG